MKEPRRLRESSASEVERLLLRVGREGAPRGAKGRALAAIGVVGASATVGKSAGAVTAGKALFGAKAASLVSLKWVVVIGLASLGAVAATVAVTTVRTDRVALSPSATALSIARPPRAQAAQLPSALGGPSVTAPAVLAAPALAARPSVSSVPLTVAPPAPAPSVATPKPTGGTTSSAAELVMLDEARGAIDSAEPARALALLEDYRSRFPHGAMGPEASILRIEALVNAGDRAAATRAADAFLRANPSSPYAPRIASLLAAPTP
jgi:hypothetical protein